MTSYTSQLLPNFVKDGCIAAAFVKILFYFLRLIPGKFDKINNKKKRKENSSSLLLSGIHLYLSAQLILRQKAYYTKVSTLKLFYG